MSVFPIRNLGGSAKPKDNRVWLYNNGNECVLMTNGWVHTKPDTQNTSYYGDRWGALTKYDDYMTITLNPYSGNTCQTGCSANMLIDLTDYAILHIKTSRGERDINITNINGSYYVNIGMLGANDMAFLIISSVINNYANKATLNYGLDGSGRTLVIYEIWLEPNMA